jgi:hypothetical protein
MERYERYSPTPAELVRFALVGGVYAIDKARAMLGFSPRLSAVEGMESAFRFLFSGPRRTRAGGARFSVSSSLSGKPRHE